LVYQHRAAIKLLPQGRFSCVVVSNWCGLLRRLISTWARSFRWNLGESRL